MLYVTKDIEMKQLREMEALEKIFGSVSHELKTPLTSIQGYVLTLLDGGLYDEKSIINIYIKHRKILIDYSNSERFRYYYKVRIQRIQIKYRENRFAKTPIR